MTISVNRVTRPEHWPLPASDEAPLPVNGDGMPIFYEDEDEDEMGESSPHVASDEILHICLQAHFKNSPEYRVFSNLNCHYLEGPRHPRTGALPYVSPDLMIVKPKHALGDDVSSYTIDKDGPAPLLVGEVLSKRSAQQRDRKEKLVIYASLGIKEYLLVDTTGRFLVEKLSLLRLQRGESYKETIDADGGVTSKLGFRAFIDDDGRLRLIDARTGKRYPRPDEADEIADRLQALEAENQRLRQALRKQEKKSGREKPKRSG